MLKKNLKLVGALTSKPYAFTARSWELERLDFVDFFDSMLSSISLDIRGLSVMRVLPRINEKLNEEWISDKIRFSYDGFRRQRLVTPMVKLADTFQEISWEESFFYYFYNFNLFSYDFISNDSVIEGISGKFVDLESNVIFKDFITSSKNIDSRINYHSKIKQDSIFLENLIFDKNLSNFEKLDLCILVSTNLRYENPILNLKLMRAVNNKGLIVLNFFGNDNLKYKNYSLGKTIKDLLNFLEGKTKYSILLKKSKNPLIILGESLKKRIDGYSFNRILNKYKTLNSKIIINNLFTDSSSINFYSVNGFNNIQSNDFYKKKILYLYNTDDFNFLSNKNLYFTVYQGHHGDKGATVSNLIFPSTFMLERKGTYLNMYGKFIKYRFTLKPSSNIRTDWRIFKAITNYIDLNTSVQVNSFLDLLNRCNEILPFYKFNAISSTNLLINFDSQVRLYNVLAHSFFINYYTADVISRSSKVMSLAGVRFKNYYMNFLN